MYLFVYKCILKIQKRHAGVTCLYVCSTLFFKLVSELVFHGVEASEGGAVGRVAEGT